ncbi:ABC transporter substrate-binding protein [Devosia sp. PTR5]|uniref:ABC transporter substrate-binding protein n=1 Tax=Devosia oryzisoli TaxID=2774138 RepID=A0A927IRD4_9HYPH|nr:ABC transporter substrate-binding protein [Devosia oryzisoli]MBD8066585.1 ABC transporter substrate-binding protein [Devosia oryzisoli]
MTKSYPLRALALAALLSVAPVTAAFANKADDTLRVAFTEEILELDYNYTTKREYIIISDLIDDTLFSVDPETNEFLPALASGYEYIDDRTIEVTLRDDVTFHNGKALTAADVAYTYNWMIDPASESNAGATHESWLKSVDVVDDLTVRFNLKSDYPLAIRDLASRVRIRPENTYHVDGAVVRNAAALEPVGLGPYRVVSFEPGQELVLERYEDYYADSPKGDPAIKTIIIRTIPDIGTQQAELMSGGVDWMYNVPLDVAQSMGATPVAEHLSGPDLRVSFIVLDAAGYTDPDGPLTKQLVRQGMNHAVNKQDIAQYLVGGTAQAIHTPCHPAQFGCVQDIAEYEYDPEKAKALFAEAGYPDGFPLDLWAYRERPMAEAVAADLELAGVDVDLRYVQLESLNQARANQDIPAYIGTWGSGGTADTAAIASIHFNETTDRNLSGDAEVSQLIQAAEETSDQDERLKIYTQALTIIADQAYWVPLVTYSVNYLVNPELDFPLSADGLPRLYQASWK